MKKGLGHQELRRKVSNLVLYELFLAKIFVFPFCKRHFNFPTKFPRDFFLTCWDRESLKDITMSYFIKKLP